MSNPKIKPPFFEVGPKAFMFGKRLLKLAEYADGLVDKYDVRIIFTPQTADISLLANSTKNIYIFSQHMDPLPVGPGIGTVLPEAIKEAGAHGVFLNHSEKPLALNILNKAIKRAEQLGLISIVCADTPEEAAAISVLRPDIIIAESPLLIGGGKRENDNAKAIKDINKLIGKYNKDVQVLHAAGIKDENDVYEIIRAGSVATGSTSAIMKAADPEDMLERMVSKVRQAWDEIQ